jgi:hypothetical protein
MAEAGVGGEVQQEALQEALQREDTLRVQFEVQNRSRPTPPITAMTIMAMTTMAMTTMVARPVSQPT